MAWLETVQGKTIVLKLGGNAITDREVLAIFASDVADLSAAGVKVVVVHGGGPQISHALESVGIPTEFIDGLRVSSREALPIIKEVLMQEISLPLVELLEAEGAQAKALNGITEDLMLAELTRPDLGYVGEVFAVRDVYLKKLLADNIIPVISSVAPSEDGDLINVNADLAASSIASTLEATELVIFTDVAGLYKNWPDPDSLVHIITSNDLEKLLPSLQAGMIPKVEACLAAIYGGVKVARMVDGSKAGSLGLLLRSEDNLGTKVVG